MSHLWVRASTVAFRLGVSAALLACHAEETDGPVEVSRAAGAETTSGVEGAVPGATHQPIDAQIVVERGSALEKSGHLEEALALYDQALAEPGAPLEVLERKALVLSWLKRLTQSQSVFRLILNDPRSDQAVRRRVRRKLAELSAWQNKFDEALNDLRLLLEEDGTDCEARLLQGQILEWQGRYEGAKATYSKILEHEPQNTEARRRLDKLLWVP